VNHDPDGRANGYGKRRTYYMGGVVYAPQPPFAIQQIMTAPLGVPDAYGETVQRQKWQARLDVRHRGCVLPSMSPKEFAQPASH